MLMFVSCVTDNDSLTIEVVSNWCSLMESPEVVILVSGLDDHYLKEPDKSYSAFKC
jgi:hypothetical protein